MRSKDFFILLVLICFCSTDFCAQYSRKEARQQFEYGNYRLSVELFDLYQNIEKDKKALSYRGIANYYSNNLPRALKDLTLAHKSGNDDDEILLYLAKIYQHNNNYEKAISNYQAYFKRLKKKSKYRQLVIDEIKRCGYAKLNEGIEAKGIVVGFGPEINTYHNEIYPLVSPNYQNIVYYSSDQIKDYDLYKAVLDSTNWIRDLNFESHINSELNEIAQSISPDGQVIFFEKGSELNNTLFYKFSDGITTPKTVSNLFLDHDVDFHFPNNHTVLFSSIREGGYGGYDIYMSTFENGNWSPVKNLGPSINSKFDDRAPFMNPKETRLFFSSNKFPGFGGFDIYQSRYANKWLPPTNYGANINTPADELFFKLSDSGLMAVMSSDRKTGVGGFDLYQIFLKDPIDMSALQNDPLDFVNQPEILSEEVSKTDIQAIEQKQNESSSSNIPEEIKEEIVLDTDQSENPTIEVPVVKNDTEPTIEIPSNKELPNPVEAEVIQVESSQVESSQVESSQVESSQVESSQVEIADTFQITQVSEKPEISIPQYQEVIMPDTFAVNALFFDDPDNMLDIENEEKLKKILAVLKSFPDSKIILTGHTLNRGLIEFQLYRSVKYVEKFASYLQMNDIDRNRIIVKSAASNYPYVKRNAPKEIHRYNQKVDVQFYGIDENKLVFKYSLPTVKPHEKDTKFEVYKTLVSDLYYRVEITQQTQMYKNYLLRNYVDVLVEKPSADNLLVYYLGLYPNFDEAQKLKLELESTNLPYSKVVAFYNGQKLTNILATDLVDEFPDLKLYIDSLEN